MPFFHEQITTYGAANSIDLVLLAAVIGNHDAAEQLLKRYPTIRAISLASHQELQRTRGITPLRATRIKAVFELARRFESQTIQPGQMLNNSRQVFEHYHEKLRDAKKEYFYTILLDTKHRVIRDELVSIGSLNLSIVHPREIFCPAIKESAQSILLLHNHPSGSTEPSREDIYLTRRIVEVGRLVGIEVVDHIIIGNGCYLSFLEQNLLSTS